MKKKWMLLGALMLFSTATVCSADEIAMLGVAEDGTPVEMMIPEAEYQERLAQAVVSLTESTLPVLKNRASGSSGWMLRSVVVGLGVKMGFGFGPIIKLGVLPRFRLAFSNHQEPSVP